jgi:phosphohistidine phosphatase SixA/8-oxo-dGTP pyrophosphatase MutT (NUDIX family)
MPTGTVIRAAGVVLLRDVEDHQEFLAVHRPLRADWSLPKGKLDTGEHVVTAAVRECDEETGYTAVLGAPLASQSYSVMSRPKVVNYWAARVGGETGFSPDDEVDEVRWLRVEDAPTLLTFPTDAELVAQAAALPASSPIILLRHTQALKRANFSGKVDSERPLTGRGRSQSKQLIPLLDAFGIEEVHTSTARRCEETVRRFAKSIGVPLNAEPNLSEEVHSKNAEATVERARDLALTPAALVLCSHRPALPAIAEAIADALDLDTADPRWSRAWNPFLPPGGFLVIHRAFGHDGKATAIGVEHHTISGE